MDLLISAVGKDILGNWYIVAILISYIYIFHSINKVQWHSNSLLPFYLQRNRLIISLISYYYLELFLLFILLLLFINSVFSKVILYF